MRVCVCVLRVCARVCAFVCVKLLSDGGCHADLRYGVQCTKYPSWNR